MTAALPVGALVGLAALGLIAVLAGAAVFRVDSMARATYALALSFVAVGVALLVLRLPYLGAITILMMIMEMAVMAVYMVMFMGMNPALMPMSMVHGKRPALVASVGVFVLLAAGVLLIRWPVRALPARPSSASTAQLGRALMGPQMLTMMVVSAVMLATVVAGVSLASARTRYDRRGDDLRSVPDDPQGGGVGR